MVKGNGEGDERFKCFYDQCPNPNSSRQYYEVLPATRAGGKDWKPLVGKILCHSCYYQFQRKGTLRREGKGKRVHTSEAMELDESGDLIPMNPPGKRNKGEKKSCTYAKCGNPTQSRRFYSVDAHTHAGGQDWTSLIGETFCHTCYYQFQRRGTLKRLTERGRKAGGNDRDREKKEGSDTAKSQDVVPGGNSSSLSTSDLRGASESRDRREVNKIANFPSHRQPNLTICRGARISYDFGAQDTRYGTVKNMSGNAWTIMWDNGMKSQVVLKEENNTLWRVVSMPEEKEKSPTPSGSAASVLAVAEGSFSDSLVAGMTAAVTTAVPFKKRGPSRVERAVEDGQRERQEVESIGRDSKFEADIMNEENSSDGITDKFALANRPQGDGKKGAQNEPGRSNREGKRRRKDGSAHRESKNRDCLKLEGGVLVEMSSPEKSDAEDSHGRRTSEENVEAADGSAGARRISNDAGSDV